MLQYMRVQIRRTVVSGILVATVTMTMPGCGGGVAVVATVSHKPSRASAEAAAEAPASVDEPAAAANATLSGFGTLRGKVVLEGDYSAPADLFAKGAVAKDTDVCGVAAIPDESFLSQRGGVQHVFVYLKKAPKIVPPAVESETLFDQKNCVFLPHTLIVRTGQKVKVLNSDAVLHNTHTYTKRNSQFNQGIKQNDSTMLTYSRPESEPIQVGCDIHPWMIGYHLPLDHPYAAITAADGTFEIPGVPSGSQEFMVWHERSKILKKDLKVVIQADQTTEVQIPVQVSQFK